MSESSTSGGGVVQLVVEEPADAPPVDPGVDLAAGGALSSIARTPSWAPTSPKRHQHKFDRTKAMEALGANDRLHSMPLTSRSSIVVVSAAVESTVGEGAPGLLRERRQRRRVAKGDKLKQQFAAFSPAVSHWEIGVALEAARAAGDERVLEPSCWSSWSALLFVDISGFTNLCTLLEVDRLQFHINSYFTKLIDVIVENGGDVLRFAGDAVICAWALDKDVVDDESMKLASAAACRCALDLNDKCAVYPIEEVKRELRIHSGVGVGEVNAFRVGDESHWEFFVAGDAVEQFGAAEHCAETGEVCISPQTLKLVSEWFVCSPREVPEYGSNYLLEALAEPPPPPLSALAPSLVTHQLLEAQQSKQSHVRKELAGDGGTSALHGYVHSVARSAVEQNAVATLCEQRENVIVTFCMVEGLSDALSAGGPEGLKTVQQCFEAAYKRIEHHGGMMRQFIQDDKGAVIIWSFGLPMQAFFDSARRSLDTAVDVIEALKKQNLTPRVGVTGGKAYCGFVGADYRKEYAIMGPSVNLAARLMCMCEGKKTNLLCNDVLHGLFLRSLDKSYAFTSFAPMKVKGYTDPVEFFEPKYIEDSSNDAPAPMVGREQELRELLELVTLSSDGDEFCAVHLRGEPGIGKTRLLNEAEKVLEKEGRNVIPCAAVHYEDPLKFWSKIVSVMVTTYFASTIGEARSKRISLDRYSIEDDDDIDAALLASATSPKDGGGLVKRVATHLLSHSDLRIHSTELGVVLGASDGRQNRTLSLECDLIVEIIASVAEKCSSHNASSFVIMIDGLENLSSHAWQVIGRLTRRKPPLAMVAASRTGDSLLSQDVNSFRDVAVPMDLTALPVEAVTSMFRATLDVDDSVSRSIYRSCGGSLTFLRSVLLSLQRIPEAEHAKRMSFIDSLANMSMGGNHREVVVAQLGNLSMQDQMILKIASAIGASFESSVLASTYPGPRADVNDVLNGTLKDYVIRDESAVNDVRFVFKDNQTQQIIYDMMLQSQARRLHTQIAEEYQRTRRKRKQEGFSTDDSILLLARHYHKSDQADKAKQYLVAAGLVSMGRGLYDDAVARFNECLEYYEEEGQPDREVQEDVHLLVACFYLAQLYGFRFKNLHNHKPAEGVTSKSLLERGLRAQIEKTLNSASIDGDHERWAAILRFQLAWDVWPIAPADKMKEPEDNFKDAIRVQREGGHLTELAESLNGLGELYKKRAVHARDVEKNSATATENFNLSRSCHEEAIQIRRQSPYTLVNGGLAQSLNSLGALCNVENDKHMADVILTQALELYSAVGGPFFPKTLTVMNALANIYRESGKRANALALIARVRHIHQTSNKAGLAAKAKADYDKVMEGMPAQSRPWWKGADGNMPSGDARNAVLWSSKIQKLNSSAALFCERVYDRSLEAWLETMVGGGGSAARGKVLDASLKDIFPELTFFVGPTNEPDGCLGDNALVLQQGVLGSMRCAIKLISGEDGEADGRLAKFAKVVLTSPHEVHRLLVLLAVSTLGRLEGLALDALPGLQGGQVVTDETDGFAAKVPTAELLGSCLLHIPSLQRLSESERRLVITSMSFQRSFRGFCSAEGTPRSLASYCRAGEVLGDEFGIVLLHDALCEYGAELESEVSQASSSSSSSEVPAVARSESSTMQCACDGLLTLLMLSRSTKRHTGILHRSEAEDEQQQWRRCSLGYSSFLELTKVDEEDEEERDDSDSDDDQSDEHMAMDRLVRMVGCYPGARKHMKAALQLLDPQDKRTLMVEMSIGVTTSEDGGEIPVEIRGASIILRGCLSHASGGSDFVAVAALQGALVVLATLYRQSRHELHEIRDQDLRNRIVSPWRVNCYAVSKVATKAGASGLADLEFRLRNIGTIGAFAVLQSKSSVENDEYVVDEAQIGGGIEPHVQVMLNLPDPVDLRKITPKDRSSVILFADTGQNNDSELALVLCRALSFIKKGEEESGGLLDLKLVVGTSEARSRLAKATLAVLGMPDIEVGVGSVRAARNATDSEDYVRKVADTGFMYLQGVSEQSDSMQSTLEQYQDAAPKSLSMVFSCGLTDFAKFIESNVALFAEKTRRVIINAAVDEESFAKAGDDSFLEPDMGAAHFKIDESAAALVMRTCQEQKVQMIILTRHATGAASVDAFIYDELALTGHPVAIKLKTGQVESLEDLWKRAAHPNGPQSLPPRCNRAWFAETFCGNAPEMASVSSEGPVWPHIRALTTADSLLILCAHDALLNAFYEPEKRVVRGVEHMVIGLSADHHGIKEKRTLRNFLMDGWRHSLVSTVDDYARRFKIAQSRDPGSVPISAREASASFDAPPVKEKKAKLPQQQTETTAERLRKAKQLLDQGLISAKDYEILVEV